MNKRTWKYLVILAALLGIYPVQAYAQSSSDRAGSAGATYMLLPKTARAASLGGSVTGGVVGLNGLEALDANPAGLTLNTGTSALFSRIEYVADIGINTFGVAQRFGSNNIALLVSAWDFGDIPKQTEENPEITEVTYNASNTQVGLSYAREFTDRIVAGVTVKAISEVIDDVNAAGVAFDAGMQYTVGESGLRFGVSLKNFGPQMIYSGEGLQEDLTIPDQQPGASPNAFIIKAQEFELPSLLNFGVTYTRQVGASAAVTFIGNFRSNSYDQDQFAGGLELGFRDLLYVRGGYEFQEDMDRSMFQGWNVGAGLNLDISGNRLSVDYAYRGTDFFDDVQMITASITL